MVRVELQQVLLDLCEHIDRLNKLKVTFMLSMQEIKKK